MSHNDTTNTGVDQLAPDISFRALGVIPQSPLLFITRYGIIEVLCASVTPQAPSCPYDIRPFKIRSRCFEGRYPSPLPPTPSARRTVYQLGHNCKASVNGRPPLPPQIMRLPSQVHLTGIGQASDRTYDYHHLSPDVISHPYPLRPKREFAAAKLAQSSSLPSFRYGSEDKSGPTTSMRTRYQPTRPVSMISVRPGVVDSNGMPSASRVSTSTTSRGANHHLQQYGSMDNDGHPRPSGLPPPNTLSSESRIINPGLGLAFQHAHLPPPQAPPLPSMSSHSDQRDRDLNPPQGGIRADQRSVPGSMKARRKLQKPKVVEGGWELVRADADVRV